MKVLLFSACAVVLGLCSLTDARRVNTTLRVANGGGWGSWGRSIFCPENMYATGYELKIESKQYVGDDTALNNIALICKKKSTSGWRYYREESDIPGVEFGFWQGERHCQKNGEFLTSFKLKVQSKQGYGDDTAANSVKFRCRSLMSRKGIYDLDYYRNDGYWGTWGQWSKECPLGTAICGMQIRSEKWRWFNDDTALNDVKFFCCE